MSGEVCRFLDLLNRATEAVNNPYFALPIDGQDLPVYRERVYAYELYHQLRSFWPDHWGFVLNGEVDKRGHPLIRGNFLQDAKPDLLVHRPGHMDGNLVIVEIKPVSAATADIAHDLKKLTAFCKFAGYKLGVLLLFGPESSGVLAVRSNCQQALQAAGANADKDCIALLWQCEPRQAAIHVSWDSAI
jgi:hypothetical protein